MAADGHPADPSPQYAPAEGEQPAELSIDDFPIYERDPYCEEQRLLGRLLEACNKRSLPENRAKRHEEIPLFVEIDASKGQERARLMVAAVRRAAWMQWRYAQLADQGDRGAASSMLIKILPILEVSKEMVRHETLPQEHQLLDVLKHRVRAGHIRERVVWWDDGELLETVELTLKEHSVSDDLASVLRQWIDVLEDEAGWLGCTTTKARVNRVADLLNEPRLFDLYRGEAWSDRALGQLNELPAESKPPWSFLLEHALTATASKPNAKWIRTAKQLLEDIGIDSFVEMAGPWFELSIKPRTNAIPTGPDAWEDPNLILNSLNAQYLKGLAWLAGIAADPRLAGPLRTVAFSGLKKIPQRGPRDVKLSNAAIWALTQMPGIDGVAQLAVLKSRVSHKPTLKAIEKAYLATAEREGMSAVDIEELGIPAYGLTDVGIRREKLGDFTAELVVTGTTTTELRWLKPDGKPQKSIPKAIKDEFAEELASLRAAAKDIKKMLPAQRDRLDRMAAAQKDWSYRDWAERYLNHPLVGTLSRRLIWVFHDGKYGVDAAWLEGRLVGPDDAPVEVDVDREDLRVGLWHPIACDIDRTVAWRGFLDRHQITQPFKQAHREVYLLTDAERETETYSNRFAAHVIRQHQFNALAKQRGWSFSLHGAWDGGSESTPVLALPDWDITAEFWVEGARDDELSDGGIYMHVATDQVRFFQGDLAEPMPLEDVPLLVFSEVMRDVDLFVGVASIGADPEWQDGGPEGRYLDYWNSYSFGDLSANAATRKELLEALVPRLKIADRCSLDEKFLIVRGDIRTYKIHLGSGNILMEPNDQYLCIVPGRGKVTGPAGKVFLPFEGDSRLSVILSKAFLLAADTKITDRTILSQIRR